MSCMHPPSPNTWVSQTPAFDAQPIRASERSPSGQFRAASVSLSASSRPHYSAHPTDATGKPKIHRHWSSQIALYALLRSAPLGEKRRIFGSRSLSGVTWQPPGIARRTPADSKTPDFYDYIRRLFFLFFFHPHAKIALHLLLAACQIKQSKLLLPSRKRALFISRLQRNNFQFNYASVL